MTEQSVNRTQNGKKHDPGRNVTIIVNGQEHEVDRRGVSFDELVALAYETPPTGPYIEFSITFSGARGKKKEGILSPGEEIQPQEGTVVNVTCTDKS